MTIKTQKLEYDIDGRTYEAVLALDSSLPAGKRPAVLVAHTWAGRTRFEIDRAVALAGLGYAGIAMDLYGKGVQGGSQEENESLMTPFVSDRHMLRSRLLEIVAFTRTLSAVDPEQVSVTGYCFGGLCALDLARAGADIRGAVSFHGLLDAPGNTQTKTIQAKILALHGWDDPMATPDAVRNFAGEMSAAKADWQLHAYGGTMHAFTNPEADSTASGTVYSKTADRRSWQAMTAFLSEVHR